MKNPFYLFVDGLDVRRDKEESYVHYLHLIQDLIIEVDWFNQEISNQNWEKTRVIATIRPEVLNTIEEKLGPKIIEIVSGKHFALCWDNNTNDTLTVPIMELFLKRIEQAKSYKGDTKETGLDRYRRWFPEYINGKEPTQYIRSITWSRPRDIVRLLNCCIHARGKDSAFTSIVFESAMQKYSTKSYWVIREELEASYTSSEIEYIFNCFQGLPVRFTKQEFMANAGDSNVVAVKDVDKVLGDLYRVGAIGQVVGNSLLWYHYGDKGYTPGGLNIVHSALIWILSVDEGSNSAKAPFIPTSQENEIQKDSAKAVGQETKKQEAEKEESPTPEEMNARGENCKKLGKDEEAVQWFQKAAQQGHARAQFSLGKMYETGRGVRQDDGFAAQWFQKAAQRGHAAAQFNLG